MKKRRDFGFSFFLIFYVFGIFSGPYIWIYETFFLQLGCNWCQKCGAKTPKVVVLLSIAYQCSSTLKVGLSPSYVTPYLNFFLGWNLWNVWFGMKEGSEPPACILYLSSFSSECTWVLLNGPNGHWVTHGQPSNTLFKSHTTQAQDFWTKGSDDLKLYSIKI